MNLTFLEVDHAEDVAEDHDLFAGFRDLSCSNGEELALEEEEVLELLERLHVEFL